MNSGKPETPVDELLLLPEHQRAKCEGSGLIRQLKPTWQSPSEVSIEYGYKAFELMCVAIGDVKPVNSSGKVMSFNEMLDEEDGLQEENDA